MREKNGESDLPSTIYRFREGHWPANFILDVTCKNFYP
jgi:hypothetical protein